jgi:hypothetical protein
VYARGLHQQDTGYGKTLTSLPAQCKNEKGIEKYELKDIIDLTIL